ncbi:MAG: hypothetical protein RBU23_13515 [Candidatus Auribacterota bacterium]|jgi:hypothetical protein|nr:hypothetical protein [Candidatus Auribacterota bacterium]
MNIYFLVEGRRTERKVYPKWITSLIPEMKEIKNAYLATEKNFYIFTGNGYPSLLDNHLRNSIDEINAIGNYNYFVICLDADEFTVDERENEVLHFINKNNLQLNTNTELVIIVQNRCIETWFLGNSKIYKRNPSSESLQEYVAFYNVGINDPELMGKFDGFETHADFHETYLSEMLAERNILYTKKNPRGVTDLSYLQQLIKRTTTKQHIKSFGNFYDFCLVVMDKIK